MQDGRHIGREGEDTKVRSRGGYRRVGRGYSFAKSQTTEHGGGQSHPPPDRKGNGASCPRWATITPARGQIKANPIPKHMSHELHEGRRKARVDRQRRQFKGDPSVTYVDVSAYPAGGLFAVAAVNGRDNSLTLAASVRALQLRLRP
ncbi:hypothetical protein HPB49_015940 [Dermacentor silvarum]|uniref:Uncharacterized protein n=1 Tax=Dermacentor silvarum TaxID=543639 RepID=A0ACB8DJX4_DERSI|nr:hypothetical protein HPB49_015940 [Dermacentor silvarum]